jgi:hypothetical protein
MKEENIHFTKERHCKILITKFKEGYYQCQCSRQDKGKGCIFGIVLRIIGYSILIFGQITDPLFLKGGLKNWRSTETHIITLFDNYTKDPAFDKTIPFRRYYLLYGIESFID